MSSLGPNRNHWSRTEWLTLVAIVCTAVGSIAAVFVVPEFRAAFHLDKTAEAINAKPTPRGEEPKPKNSAAPQVNTPILQPPPHSPSIAKAGRTPNRYSALASVSPKATAEELAMAPVISYRSGLLKYLGTSTALGPDPEKNDEFQVTVQAINLGRSAALGGGVLNDCRWGWEDTSGAIRIDWLYSVSGKAFELGADKTISLEAFRSRSHAKEEKTASVLKCVFTFRFKDVFGHSHTQEQCTEARFIPRTSLTPGYQQEMHGCYSNFYKKPLQNSIE